MAMIVFGNIKAYNGFVIAMAANQDELGNKLDELVLTDLDYGLHTLLGKQ